RQPKSSRNQQKSQRQVLPAQRILRRFFQAALLVSGYCSSAIRSLLCASSSHEAERRRPKWFEGECPSIHPKTAFHKHVQYLSMSTARQLQVLPFFRSGIASDVRAEANIPSTHSEPSSPADP